MTNHGRLTKTLIGGSLALITACSWGDNRVPTGSQQIATSSEFSALYVANSDQGTISIVDVENPKVLEIDVGEEPTRLARSGERIFATLRASRSVAILEEDGGKLNLVSKTAVGAEPFGIIADGGRVYVALSLEDRVVELDADDLSELRSWSVPHQPRWLALHPAGDMLFVATAYEGQLYSIEVGSGDAQPVNVPLPDIRGQNVFNPSEEVTMARRITGDPAVSPDGQHLVIPAMYLDNHSSVDEGEGDGSEPIPGGSGGGYASGGRFNPVVVDVRLDGDEPVMPEHSDMISVTGFTDSFAVNGYPANVSISPDSALFVVSIEGAQGVVVGPLTDDSADQFGGSVGRAEPGFAPVPPGEPRPDGTFESTQLFSFEFPFVFRQTITIKTDIGPRSVVFTDDNVAYVYAFVDRSVAKLDLTNIRQVIAPESDNFDDFVPLQTPAVRGGFEQGVVGPFPTEFTIQGGLKVTESVLGPEVERGRAMFYAANDSRVATVGAGVSCATCHFDGRNDGLSWTFNRGARQTPSLAGVVSLTNPVRWEGDRASVAADAMSTSQGLMGGVGLTESDTLALEAFIDWTRDVDVAYRGSSDPAVARGKAIFERADTQCSTCHSGARYTDNKSYELLGLAEVQTRSLVGVSATAPYFHDGSAKTLRDVLERARDGSMGSTANLSDAEMSDLEVYLKSL